MSSPLLTFSSSGPDLTVDRRDVSRLLHVFAPVGDQLDLGAVGRHAERHVDAPHRGENVRKDAVAAADSPGCRRTAPPGCRSCAGRDRRCRRSRASRSAPLICCTSPAARIAASQARRSCFDAVDAFLAGRFAARISATVISTLLARRLGSLARCPHEAELNSRSSCAFRLASSPRRRATTAERTSCSGRSKSASAAAASPAAASPRPECRWRRRSRKQSPRRRR